MDSNYKIAAEIVDKIDQELQSTKRIPAIILFAPISEMNWYKGEVTEIDLTRSEIRAAGSWFTYDEHWTVITGTNAILYYEKLYGNK